MGLTLKQLEILQAIVVAGSISQATRSVGLSQPTLSQHLAKFEEILGTQLIVRGRSTTIRLTAAGEFWFKVATDVLSELDSAKQQHKMRFDDKNLTLRFGTTPSLRGRFTEVAAKTAFQLGQIAHFEFGWATTSAEVVEMINTHKLNCGVVSATSVEGSKSSLHVEHLWRDRIVWTVPATVPDAAIARALIDGVAAGPESDALTRYVKITAALTWGDWSESWFRQRLNFASPFFGCTTHQAAVDVVAAGLATCHSPLSLMQNLPEPVRSRIKYFDLGEYTRDVVLVMPRHLLSLTPFKTFCDRICVFTRKEYGDEAGLDGLHPDFPFELTRIRRID